MLHPIDGLEPNKGAVAANASRGNRSRGYRFSLRSLLFAFAVVALLLWLVPLLFLRVFFGIGPVWSRDSWPEELIAFESALPESDSDKLANIQVYCLQDLIDTHHVWRFDIQDEDYDSLKRGFKTTNLATLDDRVFWSKPRVRWWDPDPNAVAEYVEWFGFPCEVVTMYDKQKKVLYGYSQNDF